MLNNTVELLGYYGSDMTHAQSAWCSTKTDVVKNKDRIPKLLSKLASEGHHTPFEKSSLHFLVTSDIATHIQLLKHRIGVSINSESARYKEIKTDKFYVPEDWPEELRQKLVDYNEQGNKLYHETCEKLTPLLGRNRAKESSRFFKTYSSQITCDIMFNWRSFMHFYSLRNDNAAQLEIRKLSEMMLNLVKDIKDEEGNNPFRYTLEAFAEMDSN